MTTQQPEWAAEKYARWDAYNDKLNQAIHDLYGGLLPEYVIEEDTNDDTFTVIVSDWTGDTTLSIAIRDVLDYFTARHHHPSSTTTLCGHSGEWRQMDNLAQEAFDWFRLVNREQLTVECDKRGMTIDPRGD